MKKLILGLLLSLLLLSSCSNEQDNNCDKYNDNVLNYIKQNLSENSPKVENSIFDKEKNQCIYKIKASFGIKTFLYDIKTKNVYSNNNLN